MGLWFSTIAHAGVPGGPSVSTDDFKQKSSWPQFSVSVLRALGSSSAPYGLHSPGFLVCLTDGQVVPGLESMEDGLISRLAVNIDVWVLIRTVRIPAYAGYVA